MSLDIVKLTASSKRHISTAFGNKEVFYTETMEIPSDAAVDRAMVYAFMAQRLDLAYLMDYYYSCPSQDGSLPNSELWPHIKARVDTMKKLLIVFPDEVQKILAFSPENYER